MGLYKRLVWIAAVYISCGTAHARTITYDLSFDAIADTPGTGAFTWDDESLHLQDFSWDFGGGKTGSIPNEQLLRATPSVPGSTVSTYLYELITRNDVDPLFAFTLGLGGPFGLGHYPDSIMFGINSYVFFADGGTVLSHGVLRVVAAHVVPEPGALALLALGCALMIFVPRARRTNC